MSTLDLRAQLTGQRLLVMGGTGFLGKVTLSLLLDRFPEIGHIWLVVRPKGTMTSPVRFEREILTSEAFDPIRATHGGGYEAFMRGKITAIPGDVSEDFAGVPQEVRDTIRGQVDCLLNIAGVVSFNPPLDYALKANAFGMQNLVALAQDLDNVRFLHTSTCYVAGDRTGQVDEIHPLEWPFPKADTLATEHWDPAREIAECVDLVDNVRHRANDAYRESQFLDTAKKNLIDKGEPARGSALKSELAKVRRTFEEDRLVDAGLERAWFWGWHNTYTYTKSIGEQILATSGLPFAIGRPAVIESAIAFPRTGWCEGINTSAPMIYLALQRGPTHFPAREESVLDVIPVDYVAAGLLLTLGELLEGTHKPVYQYGTSDQNPLKMYRLIELVGLFKRKHLNEQGDNPVLDFLDKRFESRHTTASDHFERGPAWMSQLATRTAKRLKALPGPLKPITAPAAKGLQGLSKGLSVKGKIIDQFVPFTATHNYRFSCANTRAALDRLDDEQRALVPWNPEELDWRHYILDVHGPGLVQNVFPEISERVKRTVKPLRAHDTLLDFLDELVARHDLAPALMRMHDDGLTRVPYRQVLERAQATGVRLGLAGVKVGDRVMLAGKNHPDWVIAYFGILAAGASVVPMDPAYTASQAANVEAASGATASVLDEEARTAFGHGLSVAEYDLHEVTAPGAGDPLPAFDRDPDAVAAILFTSGTTGTPKGVMLTHRNFCSLLASLGRIFPLRETDRVMSVLPLHHTFEFSCGLLLPLSRGARVLYLDELTGESLNKGLTEGRITAMVGVPALWQLLERRIRGQIAEKGDLFRHGVDFGLEANRILGRSTGLDVGRLLFGTVHERLGGNIRFLISGGAALPKETQELFSGLGLHLAEGYGLTEAAPVLTVAKGAPGSKPGHVGEAIPGVELRIEKPNDEGVGEVMARGDNVMAGYFGNVEATQAVVSDDGWLRTGDLGRIDHRGRLTILGRAKEVVVTASGENVYLDDVENTLGPNLPYIQEYALVGLEDPRGGERLGMLVVPATDNDLDRATRHDRARQAAKDAVAKLPKVQRPAVLHLVDADLPRTSTRKVKRREVKAVLDKIEAAAPKRISKKEGVSAPVARAVASVAGLDSAKVTAGTRLADELGFDSLMWVELASALEGIDGGKPDPEALSQCETVSDVVSLVRAPTPTIEKEPDAREEFRIPMPMVKPLRASLGYAQRELYGKGLHTRVFGRAFIPQNRPAIVVSNHCSHLDMGLVKFALGPYGRKLVALAASDYFFEGNKWWVAYFEQLTNLQPISRKQGFRASLEQAKGVIAAGNVVLLFPEGTRRTDGSIGDFKPLVGRLALETGVDILPLHLDGTFEILPKGAVLPKGRDVTVRIGPPLEMKELRRITEGLRPSEAAREVARLTQQAVTQLRDGQVLELHTVEAGAAEPEVVVDPIEQAFTALPDRFDPERLKNGGLSWYFSLANKEGGRKYTVVCDAEGARVLQGRPPGGKADCVVKTSEEIMRRIITERYVPEPPEFMSGRIKTNKIPLLVEFARVFNLSGNAS